MLKVIFRSDIGPAPGVLDGGAEEAAEENEDGDAGSDEEDEPVTRTVEKELEFADFVLR